MLKPIALIVSLMALSICTIATNGQNAKQVIAETGIDAGLAVHLPATEGTLEVGLTNGGRMLVQGLAVDDAARDRARQTIVGEGLQGLATVTTWPDAATRRLPYASNLLNLLVLDRDALGDAAPSADEVQRVLVPSGVLYERSGGKWEVTTKPRPEAMDDWTHFDYGAAGSTVSGDTLVSPIRQLQWITQAQPQPFEGNPAGYDPGGGLRIWGRYAVLDIQDGYAGDADPENQRKVDTWSLQCRDAFNGTPLWTIRRSRKTGDRRWSLVAADGLVLTYLGTGEDLSAIDIKTGQVVRTYPGTAPPAGEGPRDEVYVVRHAGETLVVGTGSRLLAFETKTAKALWTFEREGRWVLAPTVDTKAGRVYGLLAEADPSAKRVFGSRWPSSTGVTSIIALDLTTGKPLWENADDRVISGPSTDRKGKSARRGIGQVVPCGDWLIAYSSKAIGGGQMPFVASIDARTGETRHAIDRPFESSYNVASYNLLVRDGKAYFAGAFTNIWTFDPATGEVERLSSFPWNQRCTRLTATPKYLLFGQTGYFSIDGGGEQVTVARSGCANGATPANGFSYFTPNACGCITQLRGFNAFTGDEALPPLPDEGRTLGPSPTVAWPASKGDLPAGPVAEDWIKQWRLRDLETAPVDAGTLKLVALTHRHRLEARQGDAVKWSFLADGRIGSPPVIVGDTAVFGDHAGWVCGVLVADGSLRWKHLVAPSHRLIVDNAQLASAWPVYGVCMGDGVEGMSGQVIASAGTHVGVGGGVWIVGLDPATGKRLWTRHVYLPPNDIPPGGKNAKIVDRTFINSVPRVEGGRVVLGDGGRKGGTFAFDPHESDAALQEQLVRQPAKKK